MINNLIITIDSDFYCRNQEIAKGLSKELNIPCFGTEILDKAAQLSGISRELMYKYDGKIVRAAYDLQAPDISKIKLRPSSDFVVAQKAACMQLASENESCILIDRHANAALKDKKHIAIFLHESEEKRAEKYKADIEINREQALRAIRKNDRLYKSYYKQTNSNWGDVAGYDMSIDITDCSTETIVNILLEYLRIKHGIDVNSAA